MPSTRLTMRKIREVLRLAGMLFALKEQMNTGEVDRLSFEECLGLLVDQGRLLNTGTALLFFSIHPQVARGLLFRTLKRILIQAEGS